MGSKIRGHLALTGLGGYVRGKLHNDMLIAGPVDEWHERKVRDKLDLHRELGLVVIWAGNAVPSNPAVPEQLDENGWRFGDPKHGHWSIRSYAPALNTYMEVDSSICHNGIE